MSRNKIKASAEAKKVVAEWKSVGNRIVFTNGCFDIVHLGHVDYLERAREYGDKLIVGINSDTSIKILKGLNRPINNLLSRSRVLASFSFVDLIIPFEDETPEALISLISPDVLIKGGDYDKTQIAGADHVIKMGGNVETIQLIEGFSTSGIIDKILNQK
ncbi:MAG: D-glycero-beta-D-manno-heptose 1-phosphate adenylyltransferase [Cyclobacteriaceae bacterium]